MIHTPSLQHTFLIELSVGGKWMFEVTTDKQALSVTCKKQCSLSANCQVISHYCAFGNRFFCQCQECQTSTAL